MGLDGRPGINITLWSRSNECSEEDEEEEEEEDEEDEDEEEEDDDEEDKDADADEEGIWPSADAYPLPLSLCQSESVSSVWSSCSTKISVPPHANSSNHFYFPPISSKFRDRIGG